MDTLQSLRVFCAIVETGSFTKAAEQLNISTAMTSKHLANLEKNLHSRLLHRNSRHLHLTEAGEIYYRQCKLALETLDEAADAARFETTQPHGWLRITTPVWFGCATFANLLENYQRDYPDVRLDIYTDNRHVDLAEDGYDLAIRLTNVIRAHEIAKPLGQLSFQLVGVPQYAIANPDDPDLKILTNLPAILPNYTNIDSKPLTINGKGIILTLDNIVSRSNNTLLLYHRIKAGSGIGYLPEWLIKDDLRDGSLVRLLPEEAFAPVTVYAIYPHRRYISSKTRSFVAYLQNALSKH